jgi:S-adenosylmethionine decarboxylase
MRGQRLLDDHDISSIQEYIDQAILNNYIAYDINLISENNFHTKMRKKAIHLKDYLFGDEVTSLSPKEKEHIKRALAHEIQEIFECQNLELHASKT